MRRGKATQTPKETAEKDILVGTYRKNQLKKWILPCGFYNYLVGDGDSAIRAAAPNVVELWLYSGKADRLRFSAAFEKEVSAEDLAALGYPRGREKPHSERYLLFRVKPLADAQMGRPRPRVFVRLGETDPSLKIALGGN